MRKDGIFLASREEVPIVHQTGSTGGQEEAQRAAPAFGHLFPGEGRTALLSSSGSSAGCSALSLSLLLDMAGPSGR